MSAEIAEIAGVAAPVARRRRRFALPPATALLSLSMVGSGALAYAFLILAARSLGSHAYGEIAVLWGATFLVSIVLFRPLEQTMSRSIADRLARGEEVQTVVRAGIRLYVALTAVWLLALAAVWGPVTDRLFVGDSTMTALLAAAVAGYGVAYLARGLAGGNRWFSGYGLSLLADGTVRVLVALPLVVIPSRHLAGLAIAAAALAGALPLLVRPRLLRVSRSTGPSTRFELGAAIRFAAPASVIAGADQLLVNGAPLLVMLDGGPGARDAAGIVFAATMLVRVPVYLFQGLAASLLPNLTRMHAFDDRQAFRRLVVRTSQILLAGGTVLVIGCAAVGPQALQLLFGSEFSGGRLELALLGAGVACYLAAATVSQGLLAADRGGRAAVAWTASAVTFSAVYLALPYGQLMRVAAAFLAATALALGALLALAAGRRR